MRTGGRHFAETVALDFTLSVHEPPPFLLSPNALEVVCLQTLVTRAGGALRGVTSEWTK